MQTKPVLLIFKLNYTLTIAEWSSLLLKNKPIDVIYWVLLNHCKPSDLSLGEITHKMDVFLVSKLKIKEIKC